MSQTFFWSSTEIEKGIVLRFKTEVDTLNTDPTNPFSNFTAPNTPFLDFEKICSIFERKNNRHLQAGLPVIVRSNHYIYLSGLVLLFHFQCVNKWPCQAFFEFVYFYF